MVLLSCACPASVSKVCLRVLCVSNKNCTTHPVVPAVVIASSTTMIVGDAGRPCRELTLGRIRCLELCREFFLREDDFVRREISRRTRVVLVSHLSKGSSGWHATPCKL